MNKKQLLFLCPGFPESESDTRCIPALQLFVQELQKRQLFEITVITFHYPYKERNYSWNGVRVFALGGDNKAGLFRLLILRRAVQLAKALHKEMAFDFVHSFWLGECTWVGNRLSKRFKLEHCCTLMGQDVYQSNPYLKRVKPLPGLVVLSEFHHQELQKETGNRPDHLIRWGIENKISAELKDKKTDVVGVGNLTALKNHQLFLEVIKELKTEIPDIQAEIVGEGKELTALKEAIDSLKLKENVRLCGVLNREETLEKIASSKVLLHTSQFESFGMVLIEGLALGTKVFSTPVGIAAETQGISTFNSKKEAVEKVAFYLKSNISEEEKKPYLISDTVDEYLSNIYPLP